jgi:tetratricopeptide (TPR) repeat protein
MAQALWHKLKCEAIRSRLAKKPAHAISCLLQALEITRLLPDLCCQTGTMLNYLADIYLQENQLAEAEGAIREALQQRMKLPPAEQSLAAGDFMILAKILSKQGRHREAFDAGSRGLALHMKSKYADPEFLGQIKEMVRELKQNLRQEETKSLQITAKLKGQGSLGG